MFLNRLTMTPKAPTNQVSPIQASSSSFQAMTSSSSTSSAAIVDVNDPKREWVFPTSENYAVRDYQRNIISHALLKNTLVVLPTGLGKTFIGSLIKNAFIFLFLTIPSLNSCGGNV